MTADLMKEFRVRHVRGYAPCGICLGCRHGWHARELGKWSTEGCSGKRYRNQCPDYVDATPVRDENKSIYAAELKAIFRDGDDLERIRHFGNARRHRAFLRDYLGIAEEELRKIEDEQEGFQTEEGQRILKRLRWEL